MLSANNGSGSDEETNGSRVLEPGTTALPGALEVFLVRATDLQQVIERYYNSIHASVSKRNALSLEQSILCRTYVAVI